MDAPRWTAAKLAGRPIALFALLCLVTGCGPAAAGATLTESPKPAAPSVARVVAPAPAGCSKLAPVTVSGYSSMFAGIDQAVWGAADGALSLQVGAVSVWLFGDTFSSGPDGRGRFVHSTAITQDGGCLHVSHQGAQLLPNGRTELAPTAVHPSLIYWIEGGRVTGPSTLEIAARAVRLVGTGPWDFRDAGYTRIAAVSLNAAGDLTFLRWIARFVRPAIDPGPMINCDAPAPPQPHHFCYGRHAHPELHLADGRTLVTVSQNWDDGIRHPFPDYRPVFSER
jgi:hypothetical protein